ncbi:hypothetical protein GIB67_019401 [Kingdonia uniflora]|uniref:Pentatricopeptide repeat-containing protein n=1 Tax=Kingdonia uniflora TaxID=39325 RepID=A0A7J7MBE3_9MAGN|nr:hypothetical protein GIB67_019401 [Kingdonia uniflora]
MGRKLELGRSFFDDLLWEVIVEPSAQKEVVRLIAKEEIELEDVRIVGGKLIRTNSRDSYKRLDQSDQQSRREKVTETESRRWLYSSTVKEGFGVASDSFSNVKAEREEYLSRIKPHLRFIVGMKTSPVMEASTSGRLAKSDNVESDRENEVGVVQFLDFLGQLVSYPPNSDLFREFCKSKALIWGRWENFVEHVGRQFRSCIVESGEEHFILLVDLEKEKSDMGLDKSISLEYYGINVHNDLDDGFLCYLSQLEYGLSLPLSNLAKGIMNIIRATRLIKGIYLRMEEVKAELASRMAELEKEAAQEVEISELKEEAGNNLEEVVVQRDRLGRHLLKMGYFKAEVNDIMEVPMLKRRRMTMMRINFCKLRDVCKLCKLEFKDMHLRIKELENELALPAKDIEFRLLQRRCDELNERVAQLKTNLALANLRAKNTETGGCLWKNKGDVRVSIVQGDIVSLSARIRELEENDRIPGPFCKSKDLIGGRWGNFVKHASRQFQSCIVESGEGHFFLLADLEKEKSDRALDESISLEYYDGNVQGDCLQRNDEEPMELLFRTVKKSLDHMQSNHVSWNAVIGGFAQNGYGEEAIEMFHRMQECGIKPNARTLASVLPACARLQSLNRGKQFHGFIMRRCADMESAAKVFLKFLLESVVSLNTKIVGHFEISYVDCILCKEELKIFRDMQLKEEIEVGTYTLGSALAACSDLTALIQGKEIHSYAISRGLSSNTFVCGSLVELYSKYRDVVRARMVFD